MILFHDKCLSHSDVLMHAGGRQSRVCVTFPLMKKRNPTENVMFIDILKDSISRCKIQEPYLFRSGYNNTDKLCMHGALRKSVPITNIQQIIVKLKVQVKDP